MNTKILVLTTMLLTLVMSVSYAYEDPRWEKAVPKGYVIQKKEVKETPTTPISAESQDLMTKYEEEKLKRTLSTLKESPMPLRLPDTILRVMFLPYVDSKNVLRNSFYAFLKVEDGKWVLGEYLTTHSNKSGKARVFTPLINPSNSTNEEQNKTEKKDKEEQQGKDFKDKEE